MTCQRTIGRFEEGVDLEAFGRTGKAGLYSWRCPAGDVGGIAAAGQTKCFVKRVIFSLQ